MKLVLSSSQLSLNATQDGSVMTLQKLQKLQKASGVPQLETYIAHIFRLFFLMRATLVLPKRVDAIYSELFGPFAFRNGRSGQR